VTAPTFTNLTHGSGTTHPFVTASIAPTGNRLLILTLNCYISAGSVNMSAPSVSGNGVTWVQFENQSIDTAGTDRADMFQFRGMVASPSSGTVTITFSAPIPGRCSWSIDQSDGNVDTSGTDGSGAIVQSNSSVSATTVTTQPTSFLSTMTSGNSGFFACGDENNSAQTEKSGWTELADEIGTTLVGLETQYIAGTDTGGSSTWTTAARAASFVVEIAAAGATTVTKAPQISSQYTGFY